MPPSPKELIGTGLQVGGLAAKLGLRTAGAVAGRIKDVTPFGGDDDKTPFDGPAGRTESSTGRFAREETPSDKPAQTKPAAAKPSSAAKPKDKSADTPQAGKGSGDPQTAQGGTGGTGAGSSSPSGTSAKSGASEGTGTVNRNTVKAGSTSSGAAATGTKAVPRRISNPKAAAKARKREKATHLKSVDAPGATGKGGTPATVHAENNPTERAAAHAGKEAAPMSGTVADADK